MTRRTGPGDLGALVAVGAQPDEQALRKLKDKGYSFDWIDYALMTVPGGSVLSVGRWLLARSSSVRQAKAPEVAWVDLPTAHQAATRGIAFPYGHPRSGVVYAQHPADRLRYLTFADFHKQVLTEKAVEGSRLLLALGARDISASWEVSKGKSGGGGVDVSAADLGRVAATAGFSQQKDGHFSVSVKGARAGRRDLPELVWRGDPSFQLAVDAADSRAQSFDLVVTSNEDSAVNAEVAVPLEALNLQLGGHYKAWEKVRLILHADFD